MIEICWKVKENERLIKEGMSRGWMSLSDLLGNSTKEELIGGMVCLWKYGGR